MTDAIIEFYFDKEKVSGFHILKIKLELQKMAKKYNAEGLSMANPILTSCENGVRHDKTK